MIDYTKIYLIPMGRKDKEISLENEDVIPCKIYSSDYVKRGVDVIPINDDYRTKFFVDTYFEFLVRSGYAKISEQKV